MADVTLTIKVSSDKVSEFMSGFLIIHPIPLDENSDPLYTQKEWVGLCILAKLRNDYVRGKKKLLQPTVDPYDAGISIIE